VLYTRKKDNFIGLDHRADIANRANADLFISIHANAFSNRSYSGTETFTIGMAQTAENLEIAKRENSVIVMEDDYQQKYEGFDPGSAESYIMFEFTRNGYQEQSVKFASYIQKELQSYARRKDRSVKQAGFLVLRKTAMPSVLIELGFISNLEEENYMRSEIGQKNLSESIYRAFKTYKNDIDRTSGYASDAPVRTAPERPSALQPPVTQTPKETPAPAEPLNAKPAPVEPGKLDPEIQPQPGRNSGIVYKIQILTFSSKLSSNSPRLKGYTDVSYYVEDGIYKYTCGEYESEEAAGVEQRKISNDFTGAFIVTFRDGVRVKVKK
jgi:N-acetylmuramoyl-L-alanine amidase